MHCESGVIAGVLLVFLLLGYLVYALINAEAF
ncbi:TPA: K(+)-transporting ATPase subunit F [Escherichia coli]|nr:K(+)-transporting ATPase subunit F [Escherichia coli]